MTAYYSSFDTPLGPFSVAVNEQKAVVATAFGKRSSLKSRLSECHLISDIRHCSAVEQQVTEYFDKQRHTFDLPLAAKGTSFQHSVWQALITIPYGETVSYGELAAQLNRPRAARAVGRANGTNPICLIVPCHRVVGADGSLTGFAFGEQIKEQLLRHEGGLAAGLV